MNPPILKPNNVPTEPGWYWAKHTEEKSRPEILNVRLYDGVLKFRLSADYQNEVARYTDNWLFSDRLPEPIELPPKPRVGLLKTRFGGWRHVTQVNGESVFVVTSSNQLNEDDIAEVIWYDEPTEEERA